MTRVINKGFTLVEIMIVVAIIGIIIAIAVPAFIRARENSRARACQENLSKIDNAKDIYAMEKKLSSGGTVNWTDLVGSSKYLKSSPGCPSAGTYTINGIDENPTCSIGSTNAGFEPHIMP